MNVEKVNFSIEHIPDNDASYISLLEGMVNSVDDHSIMTISKTPAGWLFRISPSSPRYINLLIEQITSMNKYMGIMLNFSKSMKTSSSIQFSIVNL